MNIPCKNCLMIPACKFKTIGQILNCGPFKAFLFYTNEFEAAIRLTMRKRLLEVLKPKSWELTGYADITITTQRKIL